MSDNIKKTYSVGDYLRFIIPSAIGGVILFMIPFKYGDDYTITVAMLSDALAGLLGDSLPIIVTLLISFTGIMTIIYKLFKPRFLERSENVKGLFNVNTFWFIVRIAGMVLVILTFFLKLDQNGFGMRTQADCYYMIF